MVVTQCPRPPTPAFGRCSDCLELGPLPGAIPSARLHVRHVLREWKLEHLANSTESVVAELIANSVVATRDAGLDASVRLTLLAGQGNVLVVVWDAVTDPPVRSDTDDDAECGRGLLLVEAFSSEWGWKPIPAERGGGKIVRAVIDTP